MRDLNMAVKWKLRDGKWRRINVEFEEQFERTKSLTNVIKAIYDADAKLTPEIQQKAIEALPGLSREEMIKITSDHHSKPGQLAQTIRDIISEHRAPE